MKPAYPLTAQAVGGLRPIYLEDFVLNEQNFFTFAVDHYESSTHISVDEVEEELKRIRYIKRQLTKYKVGGDLKERLILNHLIILANNFGVRPAVKMLFYKLSRDLYPQLKTFLLFLNYMPSRILGVGRGVIYDTDIALDRKVVDRLRNIKNEGQ